MKYCGWSYLIPKQFTVCVCMHVCVCVGGGGGGDAQMGKQSDL